MMAIDVSKPIMFDRDTNGGLGAGTWQINPHSNDHDYLTDAPVVNSRAARVAKWVILAGSLGGLAIGGVCSIATQIMGYH
jgi:hypothetical protein